MLDCFSISIVVSLSYYICICGGFIARVGIVNTQRNCLRAWNLFLYCLQSQHSSITVCSNCKLKAIRRTLRNKIKTWEDEHSTVLRKLLWRFITLITFIVSSCHFICSLNLFVFSSRIRIYLCLLHIYFYEMSSHYFLVDHNNNLATLSTLVALQPCLL